MCFAIGRFFLWPSSQSYAEKVEDVVEVWQLFQRVRDIARLPLTSLLVFPLPYMEPWTLTRTCSRGLAFIDRRNTQTVNSRTAEGSWLALAGPGTSRRSYGCERNNGGFPSKTAILHPCLLIIDPHI